MACPRCDSDDVRRSHTSFSLDRIGFRRYRCRACRRAFWRWPGRHEAVRPRWPQGLEAESWPADDLGPLDGDLSLKRDEPPPP